MNDLVLFSSSRNSMIFGGSPKARHGSGSPGGRSKLCRQDEVVIINIINKTEKDS